MHGAAVAFSGGAGVGVLSDLVVIAATALVVVAALRPLRVPTIAGLILAGICIGPEALGLVATAADVQPIADLGVALLLFGIGLELHLAPLRRLWKQILAAGTLQVGGTIGVAWLVARAFGLGAAPAAFVGFLTAVSSTAIVLRGLGVRGELDAPHGRLTVGILVFQDLCVVPLLLAVPVLAGTGDASPGAAVAGLVGSLAALALVVGGARLVVPRGLHLVARWRQRDLFVLAVFLACLGVAWITTWFGVSLALGAFCAGLVVSDSAYRHQALSELIPFREILTSVFFVSVGMLLAPAVLWHSAGLVLACFGLIVGCKCGVIVVIGALLRLPRRVSLLTGLALAQMGEFAFVLSQAPGADTLLPEPGRSALFAAGTCSMVVTPLLLALGPHLAAGVTHARGLTRALDVVPAELAAPGGTPLGSHVIIAGYGVAGRALARACRDLDRRYVVVDLNADSVRHAVSEQVPAYFGDVTSAEVLAELGVARADALVVTINDPNAAERAVTAARAAAPALFIVARTRYVGERDAFRAAGASVVVAAELEGAVEVSRQVLRVLGAEPAALQAELERIRADRDPDPALPPARPPADGPPR